MSTINVVPHPATSHPREKLLTLLTRARRSVIAVALYDRLVVRREIMASLRTRLSPPRAVHEIHLSEQESNPLDLIRTLRPAPGDVVCLFDLERALPDVLDHLDLQRETIADLGISLVVWVTTYEHRELANGAPNFYAFRTSIFDFTKTSLARLQPLKHIFVGREAEQRLLIDRLLAGGCVVLSGPPGVGKTHLAQQVVQETQITAHFVGGVVWIDCAAARSLSAMMHAASVEIIGASAGQMRPDEQHQRLEDTLHNHSYLIVLDNFECVAENGEVLRWFKKIKGPSSVLIISRLAVPYLRAPELSLGELTPDNAVQLFKERARNAGWEGNDDPALYELSKLAGNLPLGIELLARFTGELPLPRLVKLVQQQIGTFLNGEPLAQEEHQRNLIAILHIIFERLSEDAKTVLRHLSAQPDGIEPEMIPLITDIQDWQQPVAECVRHGLLDFDGERYHLHPLIRHFTLSEENELGEDRTARDVVLRPQESVTGSDTPVIVLHVDLDLETTPRIRRRLLAMLNAIGPELWIDMSHVKYIDAAGMALFISLSREAEQRGGKVHLLNLQGSPLRAFQITRIAQVLDIQTAPSSLGTAGTSSNGSG